MYLNFIVWSFMPSELFRLFQAETNYFGGICSAGLIYPNIRLLF